MQGEQDNHPPLEGIQQTRPPGPGEGPKAPPGGAQRLWPGLDPRIWWRSGWAVMTSMDELNFGLISAGVAFYGMLALFPTFGAVVAIWGFFADPGVVEAQLAMLERFVPVDAFSILDEQVHTLVSANSSTLGWTTAISMALALWLSRAGVAALIRGLNAIYRERNRSGLRHIAAAFGVTFLLIGVSIIALGSVVIVPVVLAILPLGPLTQAALSATRWLVVMAVVILGLGVIYRYGPNRRGARAGWLTPGAVLALVIWGVASWGFSYYLANFGQYDRVYGALGAVVALLMWLYISAYVVLLGAALNAELELRTRGDTTVGPDRPIGRRGAYVADTYIPPKAEASR